jgi:putative transposase
VRDEMQRIALEFPCYGSRRMAAELQRRGQKVNRKRVQRLMREDNLLCLRKREFVITNDSNHDLPVYPNLASTLVLTGLDQLWVADITYIRLQLEFVYLAVMLDAFSRREIGWALDRTLEASLTITALQVALRRRRPAPGLVHHSDQGVQYASTDYTDLLKASGITISMSRRGNPYDDATCESFLKTLKYEEVYRSEYRDLWTRPAPPSARFSNRSITRNACTRPSVICLRRSSSAGCLPNTAPRRCVRLRYEFSEAWGNLSSDVLATYTGAARTGSPRPHRHDEFPAGYSWRVAFRQRPLSLHQPRAECTTVVLPVEDFQRTVNSVLFDCLSGGVHPSLQLQFCKKFRNSTT